MSTRLRTALTLAGSLVLAGGLLYLALRQADFAAVAEALRTADWWWLVPLAALSVGSVWIRAWRWRLLLDGLPEPPPRSPAPDGAAPDGAALDGAVTAGLAFRSTLIGYLVNYAAPRAGELARAANVARRSDHGFAAVVGTVVAERVLDVLVLLLALGSVVLLLGDRLAAVLRQFEAGIADAAARLPDVSAAIWVGLAVATVGVLALGVVAVRRAGLADRARGLAEQFRDGLVAVGRTGRPVALVLSTAALWACYALMADLPLRMLGLSEAYGLGLIDAWALMTVGAVGMALPSPGGAGSYHYATVQALTLLFGVAPSPAATYAVLGHAAQLVFYTVAGVAALVAQGTGLRSLVRAPEAADGPVVAPEP